MATPQLSDIATGMPTGTEGARQLSAEASALHRLVCDLGKVGGVMLQVPLKTRAGLDRKRE